MKTVIAIGGGSFQKGETKEIDQYAIACTHKKTVNVLFLPTASRDDQGYAKRFKQYYRSLGCTVKSLRLYHTLLSHEEIRECILQSDLLYIGGGNMKDMMDIFHDMRIIEMIHEAYHKGIVCVGISAGASFFFEYGYSDIYDDGSVYEYVEGGKLLQGTFCPHAQDERRHGFLQDDVCKEKKIACQDLDAYICSEEASFFYSMMQEK